MTVANFFTFLRVLLIPVFMGVYYTEFRGHYLIASGIFIFACVTDWLDGHMARRMRQRSRSCSIPCDRIVAAANA